MKTIKNILYLDDDAEDHEIFQAALAEVDQSIDLRVEGNPNDALRYLQSTRRKPDLILVDVNMPLMSGFEFCSNVRSHNQPKTYQ